MPEFRRNPITGDWVLYAVERAARPNEFLAETDSGACPFCPGNERLTPHEISAGRPPGSLPDSPGWRWRIFPNKFPALSAVPAEIPAAAPEAHWRAAAGRHEVLIETPRHDGELAALAAGEIGDALEACKERIATLSRLPGIQYVLAFKNHGQGSGASLRHPHFQIAALPFVPRRIEAQLEHARNRFEEDGACVFCRLLEQDFREQSRLIYAGDEIAVLAPYAGRFPAEAWILPRSHSARFEESSRGTLEATAAALGSVAAALKAWLGDAPYNLAIHTAPAHQDCAPHYHWRIELIPRLSGIAGFEWATGIHINQVTPEEAARQLRSHWT